MSRITGVAADIAREFGVAPCTVTVWKKSGMPVREDGLFDLDDISKWYKENDKAKFKKKKKKEDVSRVWALSKHAGMSPTEISRSLGFSESKVKNILWYLNDNKDNISNFRDAKSDVFALEQLMYLSHITLEKLEGTSAKDLAAMAKTAYEKERIEMGESTENVAVVVKHIRAIKEQQRLEENAGD